MSGFGVSKVVNSNHPEYKTGDLVWGITNGEEYTQVTLPALLFKIEDTSIPLSYYTGILGMLESRRSKWRCLEIQVLNLKVIFYDICCAYLPGMMLDSIIYVVQRKEKGSLFHQLLELWVSLSYSLPTLMDVMLLNVQVALRRFVSTLPSYIYRE